MTESNDNFQNNPNGKYQSIPIYLSYNKNI